MPKAVLTISSKNYSSWCLRGWLLCKLAGLELEEAVVSMADPSARAELLLLPPSFLVSLTHDGVRVWGHQRLPGARGPSTKPACCPRIGPHALMPGDLREMHSGLQCARPAYEPQGPSSGLQGVGGGASIERWPFGANVWTLAGPSCLAASPWRMPYPVCSRRDLRRQARCKVLGLHAPHHEWPAMAQWIEDAPARSRSWKSWTSSSETGSVPATSRSHETLLRLDARCCAACRTGTAAESWLASWSG
jgi:hypothetical protein